MPILRSLLLGAAVCALGAGLAQAAPAAHAKAKAHHGAAPGAVFAQPSPLFLHAPQFDKIHDSDFQPAIEQGMARQKAEITRIANDPAPPTFDNTLAAMERSGQMLDRVNEVFSALTGANTNDTLQKIETEESPRLAAHSDWIHLNPKLFARVQSLYDRRESLSLDPEQRKLLEVTYEDFVRAGAKLSPADQTRLKALNGQLSSLETAFEHKLLAAGKAGALVVDDKAKLAGLSAEQITAASRAAEARGLKDKWVIVLQNTTQHPLQASLANRAVRQRLFEASWTRAEKGDANDTRPTIARNSVNGFSSLTQSIARRAFRTTSSFGSTADSSSRLSRNVSRKSRLARLRSCAFPIAFLVAVIPTRWRSAELGKIKTVI